MTTREVTMPNDIKVNDAPEPTAIAARRVRRLRIASIVYGLCTLFIVIAPTLYTAGIKSGMLFLFNGALLLGGWGIIVLARDPQLRVLMAFGSRRSREKTAHALSRRVVLDEFDFHLRGEAFRISYQIIASLVALASIAGFLAFAFTEVEVNWNLALMLTFPFGILWLLALPTSVVVWLIGPDDDSEGQRS